MNKVIATGKTVDEAVNQALKQLQTTRDSVTFRVLEEPSKGFLGLIGVRYAKVEVTHQEEKQAALITSGNAGKEHEIHPDSPHETQNKATAEIREETESIPAVPEPEMKKGKESEKEAISQAKQFLEEVLFTMGLAAQVEELSKSGAVTFVIKGEGLGLIIGRRGQTLDSLQYLVNIVANRYADKRLRIILDAENYRQKRKEALEQLASRMADQVIKTKKPVRLEPMNSTERKIIHSFLQERPEIQTFSEGTDPNRRIVISTRKN
ncbi:RNA-binding cell elongation regulator Jag/EloR [Aneurinibacillus terranovensis]|uniref:RNA-binding cell elongation regulator Jag/EloR n=1 Tax=Aneurinibacillus terranovensis TaxID=278991 RepID=UPI00040B89AB|nr:RNA-binding cell elongation regulator Jag/EloR [Aneurinibacillus terranovensis]